ncbi:MAG: 7-cyano-7-deazaguanine synthase QueC [Theionarchaea archaeon]|nr:7-cyano-7-deazaguanine synthase QueC [Theionarchaea archaeon]
MREPMKAVILLSGGMDSAVCCAIAQSEGFSLYALHVRYHQRTSEKELRCAHALATHYHVHDFKELSINFLQEIGGSGLIDSSIELPVTEKDAHAIPPSYVPFRNSILLSYATAWAEVISAEAIFYGANSIDFSGYPDCRPRYFKAFQALIDAGTKDDTRIRLRTPLATMSKAEIVTRGVTLQVPFQLTWSCYIDPDMACGVCDSCRLRLKGFKTAGVTDPIVYRS